MSGVSKTPKIIAQLESRPEICPHKGRAKRTLSAPTVARCGTRSHARMQALQHIPIGWRVHTEPGHGSRTAATRSIHMSKTQLRPNSSNVRIEQYGHVAAQNWCAQLQPLPRAPCALKAHGFGPFGPSGAALALSADSIATRVSAASRALADCSW